MPKMGAKQSKSGVFEGKDTNNSYGQKKKSEDIVKQRVAKGANLDTTPKSPPSGPYGFGYGPDQGAKQK